LRGHVRKRGDKWAVVIDLGRDPSTGKRKQKWLSGFRTKKEAENASAEYIQKINSGQMVETSNITLEDYLRKWIETYKNNLAPRTYINYKQQMELHLIPHLGKIQLSKLKPLHIQSYYTKALESMEGKKTLSPSTVLYQHRVLHEALKHAVKWQLIPNNPADAVEAPKQKKKQMNTLNEKQLNILLQGVLESEIYIPVLLAITTGMRRGEICGLCWDDVDFENEFLYIRRARQRVGNKTQISTTKTEKSNRKVALFSSTIQELKKYHTQQKEDKLKWGNDYHEEAYDLVCRWSDGRPLEPDHITKKYKKFIKKLELPNVRFHDLRHSHATWLLKEGIHPKIVSERLGHSNISITMDTYSHVTMDMQKDVIAKLDNKIGF
jgi:integrase